ncbi:hypothetical protein N203_04870 [Helicobacter pylori UM084]|nr:hypothetical protein N203_04870 [Helicobacter pylori UM084]
MFQPLLDVFCKTLHPYWNYPKTSLLKSIAKLIKNPYPCYAP